MVRPDAATPGYTRLHVDAGGQVADVGVASRLGRVAAPTPRAPCRRLKGLVGLGRRPRPTRRVVVALAVATVTTLVEIAAVTVRPAVAVDDVGTPRRPRRLAVVAGHVAVRGVGGPAFRVGPPSRVVRPPRPRPSAPSEA